jgi:hypothetical protein
MDHSQAKRYAISCIVKYIETFIDTDLTVFDFLSESEKNKIDGAMLDLRESLKPHGLTFADTSELGDKAQFMVE